MLPDIGQTETDPLPRRASGKYRFSFVIANYNYARYVGRAIESALAVDWPDVEVIVVDDGSTDGSRSVIERYGKRIAAIFQPNAGQRVANNAGFARSTGDIVTFLDADDVIEPGYARAVAAAWADGVSKVQVRMRLVDAEEQPQGGVLPPLQRQPDPAEISRWMIRESEYPTPPGSGNAYARDFLEMIFPLGPEHDSFTDSTCLALAPLLGRVVTVMEPLVLYRQHGANDSNLMASPHHYAREVARAVARQRSTEAICARIGVASPPGANLRRSRHLMQLRVAALRMSGPGHALPGDGVAALLGDAIRSVFRRGFDPLSKRAVIAFWVVATLLAPRPLALVLVSWRFGR